MKFSLSLFLFVIISSQAFAQTVVSRKIAQRHDTYNNGTWEGQDSIIFNYTATTGLETFRQALKGNANIWENAYRSTQQYDFNENLLSRTRQNWINSAWVNSSKYSYTYDANNNRTQTLYQTWDATNNVWKNTGRNDYSFNSLNNETLIEGFIYQNNMWNNFTRKETTHFGDSLVKETSTYNWFNNMWQLNEKKNYTYVQQYITSIDVSINNNGIWMPNTRIEYLVNTNFNPAITVKTTYLDRDTSSNLWVPNNRVDYSFNGSTLESELYQTYNKANNSWSDDKRITYINNANQQAETITEEVNNNGWVNNTKSERQYNSQQLLEIQNDYTWNNSWKNDKEISYQYNSDDSLSYRLTKEYGSTSFTPTAQDFFYYNNFTVGVHDFYQEALSLNLYPNPANQVIHYTLPTTQQASFNETIYSMEGRLVWSRTGSKQASQEIDITALPSGQYIIRIETSQGSFTSSFIKN